MHGAMAWRRVSERRGRAAWLLWGLVHVLFLVSFRNRLGILAQWLWDYVTFSKGARLITGRSMPQVKSYHSDFLVPRCQTVKETSTSPPELE